MSTQDSPTPRRRFRIVLAISLALNLLFIGLVAGAAWRHGGKGPTERFSFQSYGVPYMQALPKKDRRVLFSKLRKADVLPGRRARNAVYRDVLAALRAEPFDPAALNAVLDRQRLTVQGVQEGAQAAWLEIVSNMGAQDRLAYADAVEERLKKGPRRQKK